MKIWYVNGVARKKNNTGVAEPHRKSRDAAYRDTGLGNDDKRRHERKESSKKQNHAQLSATRSKMEKHIWLRPDQTKNIC